MQAAKRLVLCVSSLPADEHGLNVGNNVVRHPGSLERTDPPKPTFCPHTVSSTTRTLRARCTRAHRWVTSAPR